MINNSFRILKKIRPDKVVLTIVDSPRRDLAWRLLLAKSLAEEGICTVLGKPHDILMVLFSLREALVFGRFGGNSGRGAFDIDLVDQIESSESSMFFMHDEGAFYYEDEYESSVKRIYPEKYFDREFMGKVYFWGEKQKAFFDQNNYKCELVVTGAPRLDYLRFCAANNVIETPKQKGKDSCFVLVCSRFAGVSPAKDDISLISENFLNIRIQSDDAKSYSPSELFHHQVKRWCSVSVDRARFVDSIYTLAENNKDIVFLFRPHPGEDPSIYKQLFRFVDNIIVDKAGDLSKILQGAKVFIHSESTSGVEATVLGIPTINFSSKSEMLGSIAGASEIGVRVSDSKELGEAFDFILKKGGALASKDLETLKPYVLNSDPAINALNSINSDIVDFFSNKVTKLTRHSFFKSSKYRFYLARKWFYFIKGFGLKRDNNNKFSGYDADSIRKEWALLGGADRAIKISNGLIYIIPNSMLDSD